MALDILEAKNGEGVVELEQVACPNCRKPVYSSSFQIGGPIMCPYCNVNTPITRELLEQARPSEHSVPLRPAPLASPAEP